MEDGAIEQDETDDRPLHERLRYHPAEVERRWQRRWSAQGCLVGGEPPDGGDLRWGSADVDRLVELLGGTPPAPINRSGGQAAGCSRFLHRLWRLAATDLATAATVRTGPPTEADAAIDLATHRLASTTADPEQPVDDKTIAACMAFTNALYRYLNRHRDTPDGVHGPTMATAVDTVLLVLRPVAPHITAELWHRRHCGQHIHELPPPIPDRAKLAAGPVTMAVQVDGRVRDRLQVRADITDADARSQALASPRIKPLVDGTVATVIVRVPELVNVVTRTGHTALDVM